MFGLLDVVQHMLPCSPRHQCMIVIVYIYQYNCLKYLDIYESVCVSILFAPLLLPTIEILRIRESTCRHGQTNSMTRIGQGIPGFERGLGMYRLARGCCIHHYWMAHIPYTVCASLE